VGLRGPIKNLAASVNKGKTPAVFWGKDLFQCGRRWQAGRHIWRSNDGAMVQHRPAHRLDCYRHRRRLSRNWRGGFQRGVVNSKTTTVTRTILCMPATSKPREPLGGVIEYICAIVIEFCTLCIVICSFCFENVVLYVVKPRRCHLAKEETCRTTLNFAVDQPIRAPRTTASSFLPRLMLAVVILWFVSLACAAGATLKNDSLLVSIDPNDGSYAVGLNSNSPAILRARVAVQVNHDWIESTAYPQHQVTESSFEDVLGRGTRSR